MSLFSEASAATPQNQIQDKFRERLLLLLEAPLCICFAAFPIERLIIKDWAQPRLQNGQNGSRMVSVRLIPERRSGRIFSASVEPQADNKAGFKF